MRLNSRPAAQWIDRLLGHWLLAAAIILVAAALTIPQLDKYPLSLDAIFSYSLAHRLTESHYTLNDVLENLERYDPNQTPLYYVLLHFWGKLAGNSLAAARLISLFAGFLVLATVYRLTTDFVSPAAGVIAAFVLLCNAFYAFYYAHIRYYAFIVLLAALIVWLYLRIAIRRQQPKRRDYLALLLAGHALIVTHFFGFLLYLTLSLYHLLAAPKDRRWLAVVATALIALLLAAPWLQVLLTDGVERARMHHEANAAGVLDNLAAWITVISNGSPLLLAISLVGVIVGWRRKWLASNPFLLLFALLAISIGVASEATGIVGEGQMRYMLVGMPIVVGFIAAGLYTLYRLRRWLGLLALLWLAAGLSFMQTADWELLIQGRTWAYTHPPWHLLSRWMQRSDEILPVMSFSVSHNALRKYTFQPAHLRAFYFEQHGINVQRRSTLDIEGRIGGNALEQPGYWILFQHGVSDPADMAIVAATLEKHGYLDCGVQEFPNNAEIFTYRWKSLHCDTQPKASFATDAGAYQNFGVVRDDTKLLFSGLWQPATDAEPDAHNLSFQLLDADWQSHAQIDLPASSLIEMRQPFFDLADVPAGVYRLMAVVYDTHTGERLAWQDNADWIPEMQQLAEIAIPEPAASSS